MLIIDRQNNFDLIRLLAASQVLASHSIKNIGLISEPVWALVRNIIGQFPGVPIFFIISGFLITKSLDEKHNNIKKYIINRILRVYPALWCCFCITIIVLWGLGILHLKLIKTPNFVTWVISQLTLFQGYNPDIFSGFGKGVPNGPLWTISVELFFYILMPFVYFIVKTRSKIKYIILVIIFGISYYSYIYLYYGIRKDFILFWPFYKTFVPHFWLFLIGALIYLQINRLYSFFKGKVFYWLIIYITITVIFKYFTIEEKFIIIHRIVLACFVMSIAFSGRSIANKLLNGRDLSYGLYIYHMLVINVFIFLGWINQPIYLIYIVLISYLLSYLSWVLIEKKALVFKEQLL